MQLQISQLKQANTMLQERLDKKPGKSSLKLSESLISCSSSESAEKSSGKHKSPHTGALSNFSFGPRGRLMHASSADDVVEEQFTQTKLKKHGSRLT